MLLEGGTHGARVTRVGDGPLSLYHLHVPTPHEIADSLAPDLRASFLAMVDTISHSVPEATLTSLLDRGDVVGIVNAFEEVLATALTFSTATDLTSVYGAITTQTLGNTLRSAGFSASFSLISDLALDRIRTHTANLVVGISRDTVAALRTIVEQHYIDGLGAAQASRVIRSVVGLLPSHAAAVGRYSAALQDQGLPPAQRSHFVSTYARRLLDYRADNIARTEVITAAVSGQMAGWLKLAEQGILQRDRTRVLWVVTDDDRLCPWCAVMEGVTVELGELFISTHKGFPNGKPTLVTPGGLRRRQSNIKPDPRSQPRDEFGRFIPFFKRDDRDYLDGKLVQLKNPIVVPHPPLHPQCRCALSLTFTDTI